MYLTKAELEADLESKLAKGEITAEEAEMEWQEWMHKGDDIRIR